MADDYESHALTLTGPLNEGESVTPSDSADLDTVPRALWIGGAGDLVVHTASGASLTFNAVPAGTLLPFRARRVLLTGTTATAIKALW